MASELIVDEGIKLDAATLLAILVERMGGDVFIPEEAVIAYIDRNADVMVSEHHLHGGLHIRLQEKASG